MNVTTLDPANNGCTGGIGSFPYNEGFEGSIGAWSQVTGDDLDWTVNSGTTPSQNTGPSSANEGSSYLYVEVSGNGTGYPDKQAILESPCFDLNGLNGATFSFDYHMYGAADMGTFDVEISDDDGETWTTIWSQTGNQGNAWLTANVDISAYTVGGVQIRFNRVSGSTWQADIAIDDISLIEGGVVITPCSGGITSYPYTEGFEGSIGLWTQNSGDNLDWLVDAGGTPSQNTGPSSASQGSDYIYVEASGNGTGYPNMQAIITSPCFDLTGYAAATFSFDYHMYGAADMGSIALQASNDNGDSWSTVWSQTGNQGNQWLTQNVDLSTYLDQSIQLRFNRITGSTWQADIAIDDVSLTASSSFAPEEQISKLDASVRLYPNPADNVLYISSKQFNPEHFKVFNKFNQVIYEGVYAGSIDTSRLESGVYYLELISEDRKVIKQFIRN